MSQQNLTLISQLKLDNIKDNITWQYIITQRKKRKLLLESVRRLLRVERKLNKGANYEHT